MQIVSQSASFCAPPPAGRPARHGESLPRRTSCGPPLSSHESRSFESNINISAELILTIRGRR